MGGGWRAPKRCRAWSPPPGTIVWAAGSQTWRRLAAARYLGALAARRARRRGQPAVDLLAGRNVAWVRLTHAGAATDALATYRVEVPLPDDLPSRSHFFWTSGEIVQARGRPMAGDSLGWHASGPGRTSHAISAELGASDRSGVWLDRESWERDVCL